jgi:hypothetical protein
MGGFAQHSSGILPRSSCGPESGGHGRGGGVCVWGERAVEARSRTERAEHAYFARLGGDVSLRVVEALTAPRDKAATCQSERSSALPARQGRQPLGAISAPLAPPRQQGAHAGGDGRTLDQGACACESQEAQQAKAKSSDLLVRDPKEKPRMALSASTLE